MLEKSKEGQEINYQLRNGKKGKGKVKFVSPKNDWVDITGLGIRQMSGMVHDSHPSVEDIVKFSVTGDQGANKKGLDDEKPAEPEKKIKERKWKAWK